MSEEQLIKARKKARRYKRMFSKQRVELGLAIMDIMEIRKQYNDSNIQFGIDCALKTLKERFPYV